jgi:hypothetical protein
LREFLSIINYDLNKASAVVVVNEVAPRGSADLCNGEDWVELFNDGR